MGDLWATRPMGAQQLSRLSIRHAKQNQPSYIPDIENMSYMFSSYVESSKLELQKHRNLWVAVNHAVNLNTIGPAGTGPEPCTKIELNRPGRFQGPCRQGRASTIFSKPTPNSLCSSSIDLTASAPFSLTPALDLTASGELLNRRSERLGFYSGPRDVQPLVHARPRPPVDAARRRRGRRRRGRSGHPLTTCRHTACVTASRNTSVDRRRALVFTAAATKLPAERAKTGARFTPMGVAIKSESEGRSVDGKVQSSGGGGGRGRSRGRETAGRRNPEDWGRWSLVAVGRELREVVKYVPQMSTVMDIWPLHVEGVIKQPSQLSAIHVI